MKISVIIGAYNGLEYIENCVKSFLNQSFKDFEIILFDDSSTDDTRNKMYQLAEKYEQNISVKFSDKNLGPGGSKNAAINYAKGEYISFCDVDDYVDTDYLKHLYETALNNNKPDIIFGGFKKVDTNGNLIYTRTYDANGDVLYLSIPNWGKLIKREFILNKNLHIPEGRVFDDVMFSSACIVQNPTYASCEHAEYNYVENKKSVSNTYLKSFTPNAIEQEFKYFADYFLEVPQQNKELYQYFVFRVVVWHLLKSGCGVGSAAMKNELNKVRDLLKEHFPNYRKCKYLINLPKEERLIIKFAVKIMYILDKVKLLDMAMRIYSIMNLSFLWPNI